MRRVENAQRCPDGGSARAPLVSCPPVNAGYVATRRLAETLRKAAAEFASTLDAKQSVSIDATAHAKEARATRVAQSKLRNSQVLNGPQAG